MWLGRLRQCRGIFQAGTVGAGDGASRGGLGVTDGASLARWPVNNKEGTGGRVRVRLVNNPGDTGAGLGASPECPGVGVITCQEDKGAVRNKRDSGERVRTCLVNNPEDTGAGVRLSPKSSACLVNNMEGAGDEVGAIQEDLGAGAEDTGAGVEGGACPEDPRAGVRACPEDVGV